MSESASQGRGDAALRTALVASIAVAAVAHLPVIAPHLREAPYMGVLFILFTTACVALGAIIAVTGATWAYGSSAVVCGAAVLAYAATRIVAFPQLADDVGDWLEPLGVASVIAESMVVALALLVVRPRLARHEGSRVSPG